MVTIGVMSGTSMDGIDAVAVDFSLGLRVLGHASLALDSALRSDLMALNSAGGNELHRAALASNALAIAYAQAVAETLAAAGLTAANVRAVGAHGQTVRHRPGEFDGLGYTLQLLNGALLAERCGIDVVCDLRSRDVAAGGQGAPLVPAFHQSMFHQDGLAQAVLNLGGIANLTLLDGQGGVLGFDCGPGNALMDHWCERHRGTPYDTDGRWAASGRVDANLLAALASEPFFNRQPPKSTGRDLFNPPWLQAHLAGHAVAPEDVQATLAELTASAAVQAIRQHQPDAKQLLVCGGGALNGHLVRRLAALAAGINVCTTDDAGLPVMQVEAAAFAWLARAHVERQAGNLPKVTGASGARRLGCLYPAG